MFIPLSDNVRRMRLPVMTYSIIGLNVLVFMVFNNLTVNAATFRAHSPLAVWYIKLALDERMVTHNPWTLITYMFLHGGFMHILGNMWMLFIFGRSVEDRLGPSKYLIAYLVSGVFAAVMFMAFTPPVRMIGASGAIFGVMGMYLVLFPAAKINVLAFFFIFLQIFAIPAVWFVGFYAGFEILLALFVDPTRTPVAHAAHAGGFIAGLGIILLARQIGWVTFDRRQIFAFLKPQNMFGKPRRANYYPNAPHPFSNMRRSVNRVESIGDTPPVIGESLEVVSALEAARLYIDDDNIEMGMALYLDCARTEPNCALPPEHHMRIARSLEAYNRLDDALTAYTGFILAYPDHPYTADCHLAIGEILGLKMDRGRDAAEHLKIAARTHPSPAMRNKARGILALIRE